MSRIRFHLSSYRHEFSIVQPLLAMLTCALFVGTSVPAIAAPLPRYGNSRNSHEITDSSSSRDAKTPRLVFTSPSYGASETGDSVNVEITLHQDQDIASLMVKLNGHDVSGAINSSSCKRKTCTMTGTVTKSNGLKIGENQLWASITSIGGGSGDTQWTSFDYSDELSSGTGNTIQYYDPPSVGIRTITPGGGAPWIQITTGSTIGVTDPVASPDSHFPVLSQANNTVSIPYADKHFSTDCTSILQAIVLNRQQPSEEEVTGCGDTVAALEADIDANLMASKLNRPLADTDLVILGTTSGNIAPAGLDTTDFGGTSYSSTSSTLYPQQYMLIGVKGAAAGTAHEDYDVAKSTETPYFQNASLDGTLMMDINFNYNYVPSDDRLFSVVSSATSSRITVGDYSYEAPRLAGNAGRFWLLVLDRKTLQPITYQANESNGEKWLSCQNNTALQKCGGVFPLSQTAGSLGDLENMLTSISPRNLVFLVAAGCPFTHASTTAVSLVPYITPLGGVGPSMLSLNTDTNTCAYSLVTVNDGKHKNALSGKAALSANQYSGQLGALQGFMARDKSGLYDVSGKAQFSKDTDGNLATSVDYTFEKIASKQRTDWPLTSTSSQLAAYHDISYQLLTTMGETGSYDYDMRHFYTDFGKSQELIAEKGQIQSLPQSTWDKASPGDFATAKTQLLTELQELYSAQGYLTGPDGNGGIRGSLNGTTASFLSNMFGVANEISNDPNLSKAGTASVDSNLGTSMNLAAGIVSIGVAVTAIGLPPVSAMLGVFSGALWAGSGALGFDGSGSIPGPENYYDVTLTDLASYASTYSTNTLVGFDGAVNNIFTDASKLQTVNGYTSNSDSTWNLQYLTSLDSLNSVLVAGATRSIWLEVLPNLYGIRSFPVWYSKDPSTFGSYGSPYGGGCGSVYGKVHSVSMRSYVVGQVPLNQKEVNAYSMVVLAEGTAVKDNFSSFATDSPVHSALAEFLTTSTTGLNIPPDILFYSGPLPTSPAGQYSTKTCLMEGVGGAEGASFTITPAPKAETIRRGDLGVFVLQLKSVNGFKGNVRLSCSGGPPDSQCGDLPQTVKVNGTAYALSGIRFPKKTAPGTYTLTFTGVSSSQTNSTAVQFTVK